MTEKEILNKLKELVGLPITKAETPVEVKPEAVVETPVQEMAAPAASTPDAPAEEKPAKEDDLAAVVADLQSRVTNLEAMVMSANEANTKMAAVINLIAKEPSGVEPKRTASEFSEVQKANLTTKEKKLQEFYKQFSKVNS